MYPRCLSILLCSALCVAAGCSDNDIPPRVIAQFPAENAVNAERGGTVVVQYNKALDPASVPEDAITLKYNGDVIPGSTAYDSVNFAAIFTPEEPLFYLREYDASLISGLSDTDGNRTTAGVKWSFHVKDGVFSPFFLADDITGNATQPQIAFGSNRHGHMIWTHDSGDRTNIWAKALDGRNFSTGRMPNVMKTAIPVEDKDDASLSTDVGDANSPQIAVDSAGNAIAVWSQFDGTNWRIMTNRFTHKPDDEVKEKDTEVGSWGSSLSLTTLSNAGSDATLPQIAIAPDGNLAIAVWEQSNRIYTSLYTGSWSAAATLDDGSGTASAPQIAIASSNNGIAVWAQDNQIYASQYNGSWSALVPLGDGGGATQQPEVAINPDGKALAVWSQSDGTRDNIWARSYDGSAWSGTTASLLETNSGNAQTPQVAINAQGDGFVIWSQASAANPSRFRVFASYFKGMDWGDATAIDHFDSGINIPGVTMSDITEDGSSTQPQIAIDGDGNALAVWVVDGAGDTAAYLAANRYRGLAARKDLRGWSRAEITDAVTTFYTKNANAPQIAITPDFTAMTVWEKHDLTDTTQILLSTFY